jgi:tetratricopeptide (TPR) repeat protein
LNRPAEAEVQIDEAVRLAPSSGDVQATRGLVLADLGRTRDAYQAFTHALELSPDVPEVLLRVGNFLLEQGELQTAEDCLLLAARGGVGDALAGLVALRERQGRLEEAIEVLATLPPEVEVTPPMALASARVMLRSGRGAEACALLETMSEIDLVPRMAVSALHLWGEALESIGEIDRAFLAHQRANQVSGIRYDENAHAERVERILTSYTRERFESGPRASMESELPVLIVGMPRSGTSLVEQILASHPQVHSGGEPDELLNLEPLAAQATVEELDGAASIYLKRLTQDAQDAQRITDRMPHNFLALGAAALIVPGARVVHVRRDPQDVTLSCFFGNFSAAHDYATDLESIGRFLQVHDRVMQHWRSCLPLRMLEVGYEKLVASPEREIRRLLEFCELDWNEDVLRSHENSRGVKSASHARVREPLHTRSIGRAQVFSHHLHPQRVDS